MLADHHPFIHRSAGNHEKPAPGLQVKQGVSDCLSGAIGHNGPGESAGALPPKLFVTVKQGVHDAGAPGIGEKLVAVPDQRPGRHGKFNSNPSAAVVDHVGHLRLAQRKLFGHHAQEPLCAVHQQLFHGFEFLAIFKAIDDLRSSHTKFIAFPAHRFDQDGQLKLTPALDQDTVPVIGFSHLDGHVDQALFQQAFPQPAGLDIFSLQASERRIVDAKGHGHRGFVHPDARQGPGGALVTDGVTDLDILNTRQHHDISGLNLVNVFDLHTFINLKFRHFQRQAAAVFADTHQGIPGSCGSIRNFTDSQSAQIIRIAKIRYQHLKRRVGIVGRTGNRGQNGIEKYMQVFPFFIQIFYGHPITAYGVKHRELELFVGGIHIDQQIVNLIENLRGTGILAIDLVDDHDDFKTCLQCLVKNKARLGQRPFRGVYQ